MIRFEMPDPKFKDGDVVVTSQNITGVVRNTPIIQLEDNAWRYWVKLDNTLEPPRPMYEDHLRPHATGKESLERVG